MRYPTKDKIPRGDSDKEPRSSGETNRNSIRLDGDLTDTDCDESKNGGEGGGWKKGWNVCPNGCGCRCRVVVAYKEGE